MDVAVTHGLHGAPWSDPRPGAHVARAAGFFAWSQNEAGHGCPISMTYSIVPALRAAPSTAAIWEPRLTGRTYDPSYRPAPEKQGAIAGMAMTEKQGGSDVRANTSRAVPDGDGYRLTGHKWFCSAPGSDLFLMLANTDAGITCFAVPRYRPDGTRNPVHIQRLKDKLGNRSNASGEIEFDDVWGERVGDEGRGIATIITMVNHTRLDCVIGSSTGMRAALVQALHHTAHRSAFGRRLADQPLMQQVLADLAIESEAATTLMLRLARAYDTVATDGSTDAAAGSEAAFRRLATAVAKYWVCKRQPVVVVEALECLGGAGYVEESGLPRLFRESPLNGIWEGSGNVIALDVLRAVGREPGALDAVRAEIALATGADARLDRAVTDLDTTLVELASAPRPGCPAAGPPAHRAARPHARGLAPRPPRPGRRRRRVLCHPARPATTASRSARCPRASTPRRSSPAPGPPEPDAVARGEPPRRSAQLRAPPRINSRREGPRMGQRRSMSAPRERRAAGRSG